MRVSISLREAEQIAASLYSGASDVLTNPRKDADPLSPDWWRTPAKVEVFHSSRHQGAIPLFLRLASHSLVPLPENSFPSAFDFTGKERRLPDKGFIKMCLNAEPAILTCSMLNGHLIFVLTETGRALVTSP